MSRHGQGSTKYNNGDFLVKEAPKIKKKEDTDGLHSS